jgi:hypothetical protein
MRRLFIWWKPHRPDEQDRVPLAQIARARFETIGVDPVWNSDHVHLRAEPTSGLRIFFGYQDHLVIV